MIRLINDFFKSANTANGYGIFEYEKGINKNTEQDVVSFAMKASKSQVRQWNRYGIVPSVFISYLKEMDVLPENIELPKEKRTISDLTELLFQTSYKSKVASGLGDHIREQILKDLYPDMYVMFGGGEKLGNDLYKFRHGLPLKNNTKIKTLWNLATR